ncbi:MAG: hypothetical protein JOZ29_19950 [Deltaproteobacteria bacterium]|nr:hypothetical protein [Deltaproteobacteria bacterium]
MSPSPSRPNSYWIWFAGGIVWWGDALLALHYGHRAHGALAFLVAVIFLIAGWIWRRQATRP